MEILVVVVVIGTLVTIAMINLGNSRQTAIKSACKANLWQLREAVTRYWMDEGVNPSNTNCLAPDYLRSIPACPIKSDNSSYLYDPAEGNVSCQVRSDHTV